MAGYTAYNMVRILSRMLPRNFAYFWGMRLADSFFFFKRKERDAVIRNLGQIYAARKARVSEQFLRTLCRRTFQYFGKYLVDFFRYRGMTREEVYGLVATENLHYVDQALQPGRGVIAVTAHFGNWEMGGMVMHALGYPIQAVFLPMPSDRLDRLFLRQRMQRGIELVPVGHAGRLLRTLREGRIVALLGDRDLAGKGVPMPFFGREAILPRGPTRLAVLSGAALLPAFIFREPNDGFVVRFHPPIWPNSRDDEERLLAHTVAAMEKEIGERPYQWFIFEDFWEPPPDKNAG